MYNVSDDYLEKINSVSREVYWYGIMTLTNGTTFNFDVSNLKAGSNSISRQLCPDRKLQIGGTCSSELKLTFLLDYDRDTNTYSFNGTTIDRYDFYNARIVLKFRLYLSDDKSSFEDVNLGTFIVNEPERSQTNLIVTAYDYMQKFTKEFYGEVSGMPYRILLNACNVCGVSMGSTPGDIRNMVNGNNSCAEYDPKNDIRTWRDVIGYVAAMLGGNAVIKSDNKLYIIPYNTDVVRTFTGNNRVSLTLADYIASYVAVSSINLRNNVEEKVKLNPPVDGVTYNLGGNPLIQYIPAEDRQNTLANLLYVLSNLDYTPFNGTFFTDPSLEVGDVIEFTDNHAGQSTKSIITSITLNIGSHMEMACEGDNPYEQKAEESSSDYSSEVTGSVGDGVVFYDFLGEGDLEISDEETEICAINYESNGAYRQEFEAEIKLTIATNETTDAEEPEEESEEEPEFTTYYEDDCVLTVNYYVNGQVESYHPQYTYSDGVYLLHLFYVWTSNIRVDVSTFSVTITAENGVASINARDYRARIMQGGEAYIAPSNDVNYIEANPYPNKTVYKLGETFDYTGVVINAVYEDGHKEAVTSQCTFTPAEGTEVPEEGFVYVDVEYVKDEVPYICQIELEVKYLIGLSIEKDPRKTEYFVGDTVSIGGLEVHALYSNDDEVDVTDDCVYNPEPGTELNEPGQFSIMVTYTEDGKTESCEIPIVVENVIPEQLIITTPPTKTSYKIGETLDYSGIVVTARYNDESEKVVTNKCVFSPASGERVTDEVTGVTVSYTEADTTVTELLDIEIITFDEIKVTSLPKQTYKVGENIDYTGAVVTGKWSDGSTENVTSNCAFSPTQGTVVEDDMTSVTVTYIFMDNEYTDTFDIEVVTFEGIVVTPPTVTSYWLGDETDYTGVSVAATWSDGSSEDVTNQCTFNPVNGATTTMSMSEVTVMYIKDNTAYTDSFSIEVKEPEPVLKYLVYETDTQNRTITVTALDVEAIVSDNLKNLTIPSVYTDPDSGVTFTIIID